MRINTKEYQYQIIGQLAVDNSVNKLGYRVTGRSSLTSPKPS